MKKTIAIVVAIILATLPTMAQSIVYPPIGKRPSLVQVPAYPHNGKRPTVAVVLSGGGAKGVAHIKALRVIEEAGIPIDIITGTSMGALIGGLYSIGWSTDELDSLVRSQDWLFLLTDQANPDALDIDSRRLQNTYIVWHTLSNKNEGGGMIRGQNLDQLFDKLLYGYEDSISFDSLPVRYACVATELMTNTEVDFHSGYLKQAMRASMSIPGVFAPVRRGHQILVDGGLRNNYPVDVAIQMGADLVIGVSVQDAEMSADDITHTYDVLSQIIDINCRNKVERNIMMSNVFMQVDVKGFSAASFTQASIDTLLARGEREARNHWDELKELRRRNKIDSIGRPDNFTHPVKFVRSHLLAESAPTIFRPMVGVAFRFDNEEGAALQLGMRYPFVWSIPMEISTSLRLGKRLHFNIEEYLYPNGITSPSFSYTYHRTELDYLRNGVRTYNTKYNRHSLNLVPINSRFRLYKLRLGARFDYIDYYDPVLSTGKLSLLLENEHLFSYFVESLLNTENHQYLPTSGINFRLAYEYLTDNLIRYNGEPGISDLSWNWRASFTPGDIFTIQPSIFGRMVFHTNDIPYVLGNALGSDQQFVFHQMAFPGVHSITPVDRIFTAAQIKLQMHLFDNHYIIMKGAIARNVLNYRELFEDWPNVFGLQVGYCYSGIIGPMSINFGYSNLAPGLSFYLNVGHTF
jgi:NTE family protein